jgi:AmmeMemoRadiSam system protein A
MKNPYPKLARQAIRQHLKNKRAPLPLLGLPRNMFEERAGVFVSLHRKKDHSLRGCIGTFLPTQKNLAQEIIANAISAATGDPRFPRVSLRELPNLEISVDILSRLKTIKKGFQLKEPLPKILNPKKFGLLVSASDGRRGLLLPDVPGVNSAKKQVEICCQKAGIFPIELVDLAIFRVERFKEN